MYQIPKDWIPPSCAGRAFASNRYWPFSLQSCWRLDCEPKYVSDKSRRYQQGQFYENCDCTGRTTTILKLKAKCFQPKSELGCYLFVNNTENRVLRYQNGAITVLTPSRKKICCTVELCTTRRCATVVYCTITDSYNIIYGYNEQIRMYNTFLIVAVVNHDL